MTAGTCDHVRSEIERRSLVEVLLPHLVRPRVVDFVDENFHGGHMPNIRSPHDRRDSGPTDATVNHLQVYSTMFEHFFDCITIA